MKRLLILLPALLLLALTHGAAAQGSRVVTTCGTLPQTYSPGSNQPPTVDINGVTCTDSTGGGGGAVTIADGADVALGDTGDAACATADGVCSAIALQKYLNTQLASLSQQALRTKAVFKDAFAKDFAE